MSTDSKLSAEHQLLQPILKEAQHLQKETAIILAEVADTLGVVSRWNYGDGKDVPDVVGKAAKLVKEEQGRCKSAAA